MGSGGSELKYQLIYNYVVDKIESGEFKDGDKIPSENEMCALFSVSRITVRKALSELEHAGYIIKKHSKGSFVRTGVTVMQLNALQGYTEEMKKRGLRPSSKLISVTRQPANDYLANKLRIDEKAIVYRIERLRLANEEPMSLETVYVPFYRVPEIDKFDLTGSLYKIFQDQYNLRMSRAEQVIEAAIADKKTAEAFHIKLRSPVLHIERTTYLAEGEPLEYVDSIYRGDKYKFYAVLSR